LAFPHFPHLLTLVNHVTSTTTQLMPLEPPSLNLWEHHIPDSEGTEGSEMETNSAIYTKPENVPTSDIYEREVNSLL